MSCPFLKYIFVFLLETTLSDSHTLDRRVASFTCQFCTTTSTLLAALRRLEFAVASFCYQALNYQGKSLHYFVGARSHSWAGIGRYEVSTNFQISSQPTN